MFESRNPTAFPDAGRLRLAIAGLISLMFHALILGAGRWLTDLRPNRNAALQPALQATLMQPPPSMPTPALIAPDLEAAAEAAPAPKPRPLKPSPGRAAASIATGDVTTIASRQIAEHLLYPPEAIARGLEGEAQVLLFLDEAGNAVAARLERSSGHAILDDAAVRAARAVRALPEGTPSEVLLPVRFRLR